MQSVATVQTSPIVLFRDRLVSRRSELTLALQGSGIGVDRFIRAAVTAIQISPDLANCSFPSLWVALMKACRDRLLPDGVHGAIVGFKGTAQWLPMYRGLLTRFEQSGQYRWITADFHRTDDVAWRTWVDEQGQHFLHEAGPRQGEIIETYAAATTSGGGFFISVVTQDEMQRIRNTSRATRDDAPWKTWPEEMMKKTALRRLSKILPSPPDVDDDGIGDEQAPAAAAQRAPGVQAALDQIAGGSTPGDGGHDVRDDFSQKNDAFAADAKAGEAKVAEQYLAVARSRGADAAQAGEPLTAMPEEYRAPDREAEADAWRSGFASV